ncbi:MAG: c-type cytochrome [Candidatus Marinimicrobia bacterium]|nr:c-type cytochrome [Candidatus Neomarinimicrobiota bacterium]MCF7921476.1 c-type cytochrome [Candidatus Neomarinimicrobiota bacterium]
MIKNIFILSLILSLLSCSILLPIKVGDADDLVIKATPERLERGEYLVEHVAGCMDCHSQRDWSRYAGPVIEETRGAGGEAFTEEMGVPGTIYTPNITPAALKSWTDGEIVRAITSGVSRDGTPLFPIMPYPNYSHMSQEDIYSIVAYLRTLDPIENEIPKRKLNFPVSLIVRTIPREADFGVLPYATDSIAYGKYMITAAGCADCHTQIDGKGKPLEGMDYAGGFTMGLPSGGNVSSSNITPHETGIKTWTREGFIARFKALNNEATKNIPLQEDQINTIMPWLYYASMKTEDLGAIYDYLRSIPAVDNTVIKYPEQ